MVNLHNIIEKVKHSVLENFLNYFNKLLKKHNAGRSLCKIYKGKKREKMNYNKILIYKKLNYLILYCINFIFLIIYLYIR